MKKFKIEKERTEHSHLARFTMTVGMTEQAMYELREYGLYEFDSCSINWATGEIEAVVEVEHIWDSKN